MSVFFDPDAGVEAPLDPPGRPKVLRRRNPIWRWVGRLAAVAAVVAVVGVAAFALYVGSVSKSFSGNLHRESLLPPPAAQRSAGSTGSAAPAGPVRSKPGTLNYVLMGSDSRDVSNAGAGRSDTLMVLHVDADRQQAYLISFPRDMYVAIPGHGTNKINAAFAFGGPPLAVQTLQNLLGTRMDHVVLVDFQGFVELTNELGGVSVYNQYASRSGGYAFPAGQITIRGEEALAFVRQRHELPHGDLDRAERQRQVVKAILAKGLSPATITDPAKFTGFVTGVASHLIVDEQLSNSEIRRTALSLRLSPADVHLLQAPISGFATVHGQSIDVVDRAKLHELATALQDDTVGDYAAKYPQS